MIKPDSLNQCFIKWGQSLRGGDGEGYTLSFDGKEIRSTRKMGSYDSPLHIISAHLAELGITVGQKTVDDKSNEIPAMRELLNILSIKGCIVVADALNCQKETAKTIIEGKGDYLLSVKDNQLTLKEDIEGFVQDEHLRKTMDTHSTVEKNSGRIERRTAYTSNNIDWYCVTRILNPISLLSAPPLRCRNIHRILSSFQFRINTPIALFFPFPSLEFITFL